MTPVRVSVTGCRDCYMNPSAGLDLSFAREHGYSHCEHPNVNNLQLGHPLETYENGAPLACPLISTPVLVQWCLNEHGEPA